jgi:hypothetical protein
VICFKCKKHNISYIPNHTPNYATPVMKFGAYVCTRTITVATWSKARTVFARSNAGIVVSNPTQSHGCLCFVYSVFVLSLV